MPLLTLARREAHPASFFSLRQLRMRFATARLTWATSAPESGHYIDFISHWSLPWYKTVNTGLFMSLVTPSIDPRLAGIAPGFRALSILVEAAPITHPGCPRGAGAGLPAGVE
jgi:hypothetical protein